MPMAIVAQAMPWSAVTLVVVPARGLASDPSAGRVAASSGVGGARVLRRERGPRRGVNGVGGAQILRRERGPRRGVNGVGGAQILRRERRARGGVDGVSRAHVLPRCRLGESWTHVGRLRGGGRGGECRGCECNGGGASEDASERHGCAPCVWWTVPIRRSPRSSCPPTARLQLGYIAVVAGRAGGRQGAPASLCAVAPSNRSRELVRYDRRPVRASRSS